MSLVTDSISNQDGDPNVSTGTSPFRDLSERYRDILFSSLVTSFGLDAILFRNDEENGHVDTIHNVVESAKSGKGPVFKSERHSETYAARGEYDSKAYHSDPAYINKGKDWNELRDAGRLIDAATGRPINPGESYDRDHVVAAKIIHEDPRRALSGLDGVELANQDTNLQPTHKSINRSKKQDSTEEFLRRLADNHERNLAEAARLRAAIAEGTAPEGAHKRLKSLEAKLAVDETRMRETTRTAERAQSRQHNSAYYLSGDFLGTTSTVALAAGFRMGARQGIGVVMLELSAAVQEELPAIMQRWKEAPTWKEKLDPRPVLEHVVSTLKNAWERVRSKIGPILHQMKDGFTAGLLSEIATTVINIFTGTAKRVMKMLREFWSAIISSIRILQQNPDNLAPEERLAAVMRVLSVAIGGMIQPIVSEAIDKLLTSAVPLPGFLRESLSAFAGAVVGGVVSVTLVYAIDNSPLVQRIIGVMSRAASMTDAVYKEIAQIAGIAWDALKRGVDGIVEAANSPAVNLVAFLACPPLGLAIYFNRRISRIQTSLEGLEQGQSRIEGKVAGLRSSMQAGFASLDRIARENQALLGCIVEGQERQMQMLTDIRGELREGFSVTRQAIDRAKIETVELTAIRSLQETLNRLQEGYRDCVGHLSQGKVPTQRDLLEIEEQAKSLISKFLTSFDAQPVGAPARLPLLGGMAFALGAWCDARVLLGDDFDVCLERAQRLAALARKELLALTEDAGVWQLAQENAWLIGQYVLLRRVLGEMRSAQEAFAADFSESYIQNGLTYRFCAWNDGLQEARDVFAESAAEPPLETLPLDNHADRQSWLKLAGLPRGMVVSEISMAQFRLRLGIPGDAPLGACALKLLHGASEMLEQNRRALDHALS